jgi:hypothetical protein
VYINIYEFYFLYNNPVLFCGQELYQLLQLLLLYIFVPSGEMLTNVLRVVGEARQRTLGPFSPSFNIHNILLERLEKVIVQLKSKYQVIS